ncbi:MAG: PDZ domain-containing protein [Pirellulaceae bacterium]|nr:PDZ domain-containing protein [Pirellulaceae bacterium]
MEPVHKTVKDHKMAEKFTISGQSRDFIADPNRWRITTGPFLTPILTLLLFLVAMSTPLQGQDEKKPDSKGQGKKELQEKGGSSGNQKKETQPKKSGSEGSLNWLRSLANLRVIGVNERAHEKVAEAFRKPIQKVGKSTVVIYCDKKRQSLGAIVGKEGYILTKYSELAGVTEVQLRDRRKFPADLVARHAPSDLALLKIDVTDEDLVPVSWKEELPTVGDWLATPGLDDLPRAIGVLSVNLRVVQEVAPVVLGVQLVDSEKGLEVTEVTPGKGSEKVGIMVGDCITHAEGKKLTGRDELIEILKKYGPGQTIKLTIKREVKEPKGETESIDFEVPLMKREADNSSRGAKQNQMGGDLSNKRSGFPAVLQHDTVLNPTDCGGPLVDLSGKVIGINIARGGRVKSYALPANYVQTMVAEMIAGKHLRGPSLQELKIVKDFDQKIIELQGDVLQAQQNRQKAKLSIERYKQQTKIAEKGIADAKKEQRRQERAIEKAKKDIAKEISKEKRADELLKRFQSDLADLEQRQLKILQKGTSLAEDSKGEGATKEAAARAKMIAQADDAVRKARQALEEAEKALKLLKEIK